MQDVPPRNAPSLLLLFRAWLSIGAQSFGGGQATQALIRRVIVEEQGWISEEEFVQNLTLGQMAPGMNLLAMTNLIGARLAGGRGVAVSLLGLLLPSVALTIVLTASLHSLQHLAPVRAALREGVVPATVGMGLYTGFQNARTLLRQRGRWPLGAGLLLLGGSAAAAAAVHVPIALLLAGAGGIGALLGLLRPPDPTERAP